VAKVLDFGIAMLSDRTRVTKTGTTVGTVAYMSPEQAQGGDVTPRSDVWSLGVILYELLTGRLPFEAGHEAAIFYAITNEPHKPVTERRDDVPLELVRVVDRALAKNPGERYRDAGEMARDLRDAIKGLADREWTPVSTGAGQGGRRRRLSMWLPVALVALITVGFLVIKPLLFDGELVSAPHPIAVISFENQTGQAEYDYLRKVIPNLLITSLEQSKYLSVVTWERMHDLLEQAGRGDVELIDRESGFEVCRMDNIDTIVLGSFSKAGDVFVTDVKVLDVHSKELLKSASAKGDGVGSILESQIDELGREISRGAGLSERSIAAAASRPIAAVTTESMEAYDDFLRGRDAWQKYYFDDASRYLRRAVEIDTSFAIAWSYLAFAYLKLGDINASNDAYQKAMVLSAKAPEKERLWIQAMYAYTIEDDINTFYRLLTELTDKYPKEKGALVQLGLFHRTRQTRQTFDKAEEAFKRALDLDPTYGEALNGIAYLYAGMEDYERAIEYFERYAAASPGDANPFDSMGEMYFSMGKLDAALAMFERALDVKPGFGSEGGIAYIRALREDYAGAIEMAEKFLASAPSLGMNARGRFQQSYYYMFGCRWHYAVESAQAAEQAFGQMGDRWGLVGGRWLEAWVRYLMGDYERSRECLDETLSMADSINRLSSRVVILCDVARGLIDLKEGLVGGARARLDDIGVVLATKDPACAGLAEYVAALYRAEVLLAEGSPDKSIEVSRSLPLPGIPAMSSEDMLFYSYPADRDVLARAYIQRGAIYDAIAEYERLITFDPDSKDRRLVYPLFHYRLGVLYEKAGQADRAARQYEKLLEICGDVVPEIAEVADARRRLAALPQSID
jgi:tetratricopeptide (TPR) repeat protein